MRRINVFAAAAFGLILMGQSAFAGHCRSDCSSPKCHPFSGAAEKLGFSYFHGGHDCVNRRCPPYIYPNRAPRDFWMLR